MKSRYCLVLINFFIFLTVLLFLSCNNSSLSKSNFSRSGKYEFYNIVTLKGQKPINSFFCKYPYAVIEEDSQSLVITHRLSLFKSRKIEFLKDGDLLWREVELERGKMTLTYYEYHSHDSIVMLVLDDSEKKGTLSTVSVFKKNEILTFVLDSDTNFLTKPTYKDAISFLTSYKHSIKESLLFSLDGESVLLNFLRLDLHDSSKIYKEVFKFTNSKKQKLGSWLIYKWFDYDKTFLFYSEKENYLK